MRIHRCVSHEHETGKFRRTLRAVTCALMTPIGPRRGVTRRGIPSALGASYCAEPKVSDARGSRLGDFRPTCVPARATCAGEARNRWGRRGWILRLSRPANLRFPARCERIAYSVEAVRRSRIRLLQGVRARNFGARTLQLRDRVQRTRDGQPVAETPPPIRSFQSVTAFALAPRFHQPLSRRCATPRDNRPSPEFSTALPMTPNIYYQRQPCLTNNSQAFTECGTYATNIGRRVTHQG